MTIETDINQENTTLILRQLYDLYDPHVILAHAITKTPLTLNGKEYVILGDNSVICVGDGDESQSN